VRTIGDRAETGRRLPWREEAAALGREAGIPGAVALAVMTALSVALGFLVTKGLGGSVVRADVDVAEALVAARTSTMTAVTGAATVLADSLNVALLWVAAMAVAAWRTRSLRASFFLLTAIGGEKLTYLFTGTIVGRPRPSVEALGTVHATHSFPSGHVGSAIVLYGGIVIAILWHDAATRGRWRPLALRVALGLAVLGDVIWGAALGVIWIVLGWRWVLRGHGAPPAR
jgi:hypothetical protein